jgi:hypothetical protein
MSENTYLKSQIEELCKANSLKYHFRNDVPEPRVLINDEFWFDYDTNIDMDNLECYINIITGKNEIVNMICEKLNTTIENGCIFKAYEYFQGEDVCVNKNCITIDINNISSKNDEAYTSYGKSIHFNLKIYVKGGGRYDKYYLIDNRYNDNNNEKKEFRIENISKLRDILNQRCI